MRTWRTGLAVLWLALLAVVAPVPDLLRAFDAFAAAGCCTSDCCCAGGAPCAPQGPSLMSRCCCEHHGGATTPASAVTVFVHAEGSEILTLIPRTPVQLAPARLAEDARPSPEPPPPRRLG